MTAELVVLELQQAVEAAAAAAVAAEAMVMALLRMAVELQEAVAAAAVAAVAAEEPRSRCRSAAHPDSPA